MAVPAPPAKLNPRVTVWKAEAAFLRVHRLAFGPGQFNGGGSGVQGRFHFFNDAAGTMVPIFYAADTEDGAIAETLFRDIRGGGVMLRGRLAGLALARLTPVRDLKLIELHGFGLKRLGLHPNELTSTDASEYPRTVAWAEAFHAAVPEADGLVWMSHQFNTSRALMLFGDRMREGDLVAGPVIPLSFGAGLDIGERSANAAGITIV